MITFSQSFVLFFNYVARQRTATAAHISATYTLLPSRYLQLDQLWIMRLNIETESESAVNNTLIINNPRPSGAPSDNCFMETCDNVEYWSRCCVVTISTMINAITDFRAGRRAVCSCESRKSKICCTNGETRIETGPTKTGIKADEQKNRRRVKAALGGDCIDLKDYS